MINTGLQPRPHAGGVIPTAPAIKIGWLTDQPIFVIYIIEVWEKIERARERSSMRNTLVGARSDSLTLCHDTHYGECQIFYVSQPSIPAFRFATALTPLFPSNILFLPMLRQVPLTNSGKKRVAVLGGGTGTFTALTGLKKHPIHIAAIVNISDDGGSTGVLRDELGVLPPGDIRQCLIALSKADKSLRDLFLYRFADGSLNGHNFGNLFLTALEKIHGDPIHAINETHSILRVKGRVIPVSRTPATLEAELADGTVLRGQHVIDTHDGSRSPIERCWLQPSVQANPEALDAIKDADAIVIAPGDVYSSLIPVLLVHGITRAIQTSHAKLIQIVNLASKAGRYESSVASKYIETIASYLGSRNIDIVIMNSAKPSATLTERYIQQNELPIEDDLRENNSYEVWRGPLISDEIQEQLPQDKIQRSLLRHDPDKLAAAIMEAIESQ